MRLRFQHSSELVSLKTGIDLFDAHLKNVGRKIISIRPLNENSAHLSAAGFVANAIGQALNYENVVHNFCKTLPHPRYQMTVLHLESQSERDVGFAEELRKAVDLGGDNTFTVVILPSKNKQLANDLCLASDIIFEAGYYGQSEETGWIYSCQFYPKFYTGLNPSSPFYMRWDGQNNLRVAFHVDSTPFKPAEQIQAVAQQAIDKEVANESYVQSRKDFWTQTFERYNQALKDIAAPPDCGCSPCVGQCRSKTSLEIENEAMRETAAEALRQDRGITMTSVNRHAMNVVDEPYFRKPTVHQNIIDRLFDQYVYIIQKLPVIEWTARMLDYVLEVEECWANLPNANGDTLMFRDDVKFGTPVIWSAPLEQAVTNYICDLSADGRGDAIEAMNRRSVDISRLTLLKEAKTPIG